MYLKYYLEQLGYLNIPQFLLKYFTVPSLVRLKDISYFCGMDYASKEIYNFKEPITRFDHSLSVCLLVYKLAKNKEASLAGLFHDIATPCFSHVIDYMNNDYEKQESTEEYTEYILKRDKYLLSYLKEDKIALEALINFKQYSVVDNPRPKLCADRLDGLILTGISWTKDITKEDIKAIVNDLQLFLNEDRELEIGFNSLSIAQKVLEVNDNINIFCHSKEDNYMMQFLADITRLALKKQYLKYEDLYYYNEKQLFNLLKAQEDKELKYLINKFTTIKKEAIPSIDLPKVKVRTLNPLVNNQRLK